MTRFGDFTLLEDLGRSTSSDRYKASHTTLGGPFFLKVYSRLDPSLHDDLLHRCEALLGRTHPNLAQHLGHGVVDGLPFVVSPYLEGIDLAEMSVSLLDRRVTIGLEQVILVLGDLASGVGALHGVQSAPANGHTPTLSHGDVSVGHVRVGADGQVWLTGLTTPRIEKPGRALEGRWDLAGVGALVYDLVPLLRGGAQRPPLPAPLDRVVRRALGIGAPEDRLAPTELVDRLTEVSAALKLKPDRGQFGELVRRTVRAVEKRVAETGSRPVAKVQPAPVGGGRRSPADAIPSLDPVDRLPTLEPLGKPTGPVRRPEPLTPAGGAARPAPIPAPAPILELIPLDAPSLEPLATTKLVQPPPRPSSTPAPAAYEPSREIIIGRAEAEAPLLRPLERAPTPRPVVPAAPLPATLMPQPHTDLRAMQPPRPMPPPRTATPPPLPSSTPKLRGPAASVDDPFAPSPHSDPRMTAPTRPRIEAPRIEGARIEGARIEGARVEGPGFADLPPDLDESVAPAPAPLPAPRTAPPVPRTKVPPKKPLLADPDDPQTAPSLPAVSLKPVVNPALDERTKDATDPEQKSARVTQARNDPSVRALLARGVVSEAALSEAILEHATRGGRVIEILVAHGAVTDGAVADALAAAAERPRLSDDALKQRLPPASLVRRLPQTYVLARRILPLSFDGGVLQVAVADPFDAPMLEELKNLLGAGVVEPVVAARAALTAITIEAYRQLGIGGVPGTSQGKANVLLCTGDDNKAQRIGARLAEEGYHVEHVVDGKAAKDIVANRPPDVVLAAHDLAQVNTGALVLFAREHDRTAELPFFVFGPRGDEALMTRLLDLGADDFFSEPLKLEVLLSKIRKATRRGRAGLDDPSMPGGFVRPMSSIDDRTPIQPIETVAPVPKRAEPAFLENIAMPSLDDLPELPPDFSGGEEPMQEPPSMPTGVMGTLRQMALPEIVQSLEMGRKTARVDLVPADGSEKGMIAFEMGQIRYAECGALRGDDAFYQLARHKEGFFRIHYGDKPPEINIEHPTTFLLLEAMRRMDEEGVS